MIAAPPALLDAAQQAADQLDVVLATLRQLDHAGTELPRKLIDETQSACDACYLAVSQTEAARRDSEGAYARSKRRSLDALIGQFTGRDVTALTHPCVDCGEHEIVCACVRAGEAA